MIDVDDQEDMPKAVHLSLHGCDRCQNRTRHPVHSHETEHGEVDACFESVQVTGTRDETANQCLGIVLPHSTTGF